MTVTLNITRALMQSRLGSAMTGAGIDADLKASYGDSIAVAMRDLGLSVLDPTTPTDAELSSIASADESRFYDLVEFRLLESVRNRVSLKVTMSMGDRKQDYSDIADSLGAIIKDKKQHLADVYGFGLQALGWGVVSFSFAETNE